MRCLVVTPHRLGIREVAERVGQEWEASGHDVDYLLARGAAARIGPLTIGAPGIAIWWYRNLRRIARDADQYDLIWTHQPIAPIIPSHDPEFWKRVVVTVHTTLRREYSLAREGIYPKRLIPYYWFVKSIESRFHRRLAAAQFDSPRYTVVAPHLRDELRPFGISDARYVPNGVFTPDTEDFAPIRGDYGIPAEATLVFNIGSLTHQKRAATFARVLRESIERLDDTYGVIAGDGPLREHVDKYASDRLLTVGYVDDEQKWRWFADADVYASLSAYEGMPVAAAEALSFSLPVVLSDIPAHRHLFRTYDIVGNLVGDDPGEIAEAISSLSGRRSRASLPSWSEVAERYLTLVT